MKKRLLVYGFQKGDDIPYPFMWGIISRPWRKEPTIAPVVSISQLSHEKKPELFSFFWGDDIYNPQLYGDYE